MRVPKMLRNGSGIGQDEEMPKDPRFHMQGPDPIEGSEDLFSAEISFVPADYPQIQITWGYVIRSRDHLCEEGAYLLRDGEVLYPSGMRVEPWAGTPADEWLHVGASFIRDLPTARLERAARVLVEMDLAGREEPTQDSDAADVAELARELVRERWPDLDPEAGAGAARRWNRLVRLAEVVHEHQAARIQGEKAPANAVAKARGVESSTVRSWLHQAKQEGISPRPMRRGMFIREVISDRLPNAQYRKN